MVFLGKKCLAQNRFIITTIILLVFVFLEMNTVNMLKVTIFVFAMFAMNTCDCRELLGIPPDSDKVELCTSRDFAAAFQSYCFSIDSKPVYVTLLYV